MQGWIRSMWRFFYFAFSTTFGIAGFFWAVLRGDQREVAGKRFRTRWLSHVPYRLGLRMEMEGIPHPGPCLYVGNHLAYIDPIVVLMHVDAKVVAKAEISSWPLVGYSASMIGTIFVRREEKNSREEAAKSIREALESRSSILVFPEGTTSAGPGTLPFRPRSFDAAFLSGVPVQPVAISYDSPAVPYIGNDTFIPHFFRLFSMRLISGRVVFGPAMYGENTCEMARKWIEEELMNYKLKTEVDEPAP